MLFGFHKSCTRLEVEIEERCGEKRLVVLVGFKKTVKRDDAILAVDKGRWGMRNLYMENTK